MRGPNHPPYGQPDLKIFVFYDSPKHVQSRRICVKVCLVIIKQSKASWSVGSAPVIMIAGKGPAMDCQTL